MATRGWANIVPPAIRATASTPNVVFILHFLLPCLSAFHGPIAKLLKMLDSGVSAAQDGGGGAPRRWFSADHGLGRAATPAAVGGLSDKDGVFRGQLAA